MVSAAAQSLRRSSLFVVAGTLGFFLVDRVPIPITQGDTYGLAASSRALVGCAHDGHWVKCPGADKYGLQQHALGLMLAWKGLDDKSLVTVLALVNLVVFIVLLVVLARTRAISPAGRGLVVLAFLLGPPLVYSIQTFGDSLSLTVNCGLVVALLRRSNPWIIAVLAAYACTARETAVLSVFPIAVAVLLMLGARARQHNWWSVNRAAALALVAGCAGGLLADGLFNVWRYGGLGNPAYGASSNITPGIWLKVKAAAALWVSPGGGNLLYWFLGALLAVVLPVLALRSDDRRRVAAGALVVLGLAAQTALLSAWWAPFGWYAWGPRLFLSTLGMAVVAGIGVFDREFHTALSWLRRHLVAVTAPLLGLTIVSAAANLGFLVDPKSTLLWFYAPHTAACPEDIAAHASAYYHCIGGLMTWRPRNSLWSVGIHHIKSLDGTLLMLSALLAMFALLDARRFHAITAPDRNTDDP